MAFSLAQDSTGIGYYSVCAILMGVVEDSSQTRATGISVKLEQFCEICTCKNRCSGTQPLQFIEGLLVLAVPLDGSLFFSTFSPDINSCRGCAICTNLGIN